MRPGTMTDNKRDRIVVALGGNALGRSSSP